MVKVTVTLTDEQILDYYDQVPTVTIKQLAELSGRSREYVKKLLMEHR